MLKGLMPQLIEMCDSDMTIQGKQAIQARCVLAEIQNWEGDYAAARATLKGCGKALQQEVHAVAPLPRPTLRLLQRVALAFLDANDEATCDRVLKVVAAALDAQAGKANEDDDMDVLNFFMSTASRLREASTWERCRPRVERALALSLLVLGEHHKESKRIETVLETRKLDTFRAYEQPSMEKFMNGTRKQLVISVYDA